MAPVGIVLLLKHAQPKSLKTYGSSTQLKRKVNPFPQFERRWNGATTLGPITHDTTTLIKRFSETQHNDTDTIKQ